MICLTYLPIKQHFNNRTQVNNQNKCCGALHLKKINSRYNYKDCATLSLKNFNQPINLP